MNTPITVQDEGKQRRTVGANASPDLRSTAEPLTNPADRHWVNVAAYNQAASAEVLQGFLEQEGFESRVHDERSLQRYWFWTTPQAGIHVQVPKASFEQVIECFESDSRAQAFLQPAIRCPSCNSSRVQYPQMTHKFIFPTLIAQLLVLSRIMKRECYCEACHNTWVPTLTRDPRRPAN